MSVRELERALARLRDGERDPASAEGIKLTTDEALAIRDAGNIPDADGRSLRLVLLVEDGTPGELELKRARFEPDFHDAPEWRREGSVQVNVVPIRSQRRDRTALPWWEQPEMRVLEEEWRAHGTAAGIPIAGDYRSFVYKTIVALRASGVDVTPDSIAASIARWLSPEDVARIRSSMETPSNDEGRG